MVEINLESMHRAEVKEIGGERILITLTNCTGEKIEIVTTIEAGEWMFNALEKVCVDKCYWHENMQNQIDEAEETIDKLTEFIENYGLDSDIA